MNASQIPHILFDLDADGGFTAVDLKTGLSAYAFPTSKYADAARKAPAKVAEAMMKNENKVAFCHTGEAAERDKARIEKLLAKAQIAA